MFVKLPTYKISADGLDENIDMIAVTSNPAIMIKGVKLSSHAQMTFAADAERMIIAGPAIIPNMEIYRNDEDGEYNVVFTEQVTAQLVEKFAKKNSTFNVEHTKEPAPVFVLEHWIIEDPAMDKSRTFGFTDLPKGTWFVMAKVTDKKFWDDEVKKQGKLGFSIEGLLGLKLTKNIMKKKFKNVKRFAATKKFKDVEGVTPEDAVVTVAADEIAVDAAVTVIDENLDVVEDYTGEVLIENEVVTITEGVITEVIPEEKPAEDVPAEDVPVEAAEDVPAEPAEDVPAEPAEDVPAEPAAIDEEAILAIIQPKLDEIYAAIAAIQIESQQVPAEEPVKMSALDKKIQAMKLINAYSK